MRPIAQLVLEASRPMESLTDLSSRFHRLHVLSWASSDLLGSLLKLRLSRLSCLLGVLDLVLQARKAENVVVLWHVLLAMLEIIKLLVVVVEPAASLLDLGDEGGDTLSGELNLHGLLRAAEGDTLHHGVDGLVKGSSWALEVVDNLVSPLVVVGISWGEVESGHHGVDVGDGSLGYCQL